MIPTANTARYALDSRNNKRTELRTDTAAGVRYQTDISEQ